MDGIENFKSLPYEKRSESCIRIYFADCKDKAALRRHILLIFFLVFVISYLVELVVEACYLFLIDVIGIALGADE